MWKLIDDDESGTNRAATLKEGGPSKKVTRAPHPHAEVKARSRRGHAEVTRRQEAAQERRDRLSRM